jgi:hypothetical protein
MVLGGLAAVSVLVAATAASASPLTPTEQAHLDDIAQFFYRNSPINPNPSEGCQQTCAALWTAEQNAPQGIGATDKIWSNVVRMNTVVGLIGTRIASDGSFAAIDSAPVVGGAFIAFDTGWAIGTGLRKLFLHVHWTYGPWNTTYADPSTIRLSYRDCDVYGNPSTYTPAGFYLTHPDPSRDYFNTVPNRCLSGWAAFPLGPANYVASDRCPVATDQYGNVQWGPFTYGLYYVGPAVPGVDGPLRDYSGQAVTKTFPAPPDPGYSTTLQRIESLLESHDYEPENEWFTYELGDRDACNPADPTVCNLADQSDSRCRPIDGGTPTGVDPDPSYDHPWTRRYAPAPGTQEFLTSDGDTVELLRGTVQPTAADPLNGFGYRHIVAKHGWGQGDVNHTATALRSGVALYNPTGVDRTEYAWDYTGQDGTTHCRRTVLVERGVEDDEAARDVGPAGIITSYADVVP